MPGTVVSVAVEKGDEVTAGRSVLVLEAMKMQHTVAAPYEGVLVEVDVTVGSQVSAGQLLARLDNEVNENGALP
jgi:biotin carboxyl carrier protein